LVWRTRACSSGFVGSWSGAAVEEGSWTRANFWLRLERRICAEFEGFDDRQLRWYWCDGLIAEEYDLLCEINQARGSEDRFDLVVEVDPAADVRRWKAAGATWVLTSIEPQPPDHVEREIIEAGR